MSTHCTEVVFLSCVTSNLKVQKLKLIPAIKWFKCKISTKWN